VFLACSCYFRPKIYPNVLTYPFRAQHLGRRVHTDRIGLFIATVCVPRLFSPFSAEEVIPSLHHYAFRAQHLGQRIHTVCVGLFIATVCSSLVLAVFSRRCNPISSPTTTPFRAQHLGRRIHTDCVCYCHCLFSSTCSTLVVFV
jgi:hypothetical protein